MKCARTILLFMVTVSGGLTVLSAQTPAPTPNPNPHPTFEVASIRRLTDNGGGATAVAAGATTRPGNYFRHTGSIRLLIRQAYGADFTQQIGGPEWIREDSYSINALVPEGVERTPENMSMMARGLLEDRFKLVVRQEKREVPIYALVFAKADKTLGPKLRPFPAAHCQATPSDPECRTAIGNPTMGTPTLRTMRGRNIAFERFAPWMTNVVGRPIVDRTGLKGLYDWDISYAPDAAVAAGTSEAPSLFTALQEQLGLKLEAERAPMDVVVIASIERPTEN